MKAQIIRHGEVLLKPIDTLPKKAKLVEKKDKVIVAHSETGHHHILEVKNKVDMSKIKVYSWNGETYLEVPQISELWHQKTGKDVHIPHEVIPSIYKVIIKKEFDYFRKAIVNVRD
jgi:hypothetical protein